MAREVATLLRTELAPPPGGEPERAGDEPVDVAIDDYEGCPRYIGRLFRDVRIGPSPPWLRARLTAAGMRPISNVVDVTNYVMHGLGNPLHAFDHSTLAGPKIVVRRARPGEELRTLDGNLRKLEPADLVIADAERAIALAGIMGGEETEVTATTTDVLLEAANFEPTALWRTSERLRLRTEGSNRWEKGVDPHLAGPAATWATELIVSLTGARWVGARDVHEQLPERPVIRFRPEAANALIGLDVPEEEQYDLLDRLGFDRSDGEVVAPTWRARDVTREVDVTEEVARFELDRVPFTLPLRRHSTGRLTREQRVQRRIEDALAGLGLSEVYTPSLVGEDADPRALRLPEPISIELAVLRTTLLPSLVAAAQHNLELGNEGVGLFEIARVYLPREGEQLPEERIHVAGVLEGDFSRAKGIVEALHEALKAPARYERGEHRLLHPGKAARVEAGVLGELHPAALEGRWGAFELDLHVLAEAARDPVVYQDVVTYPAVKQDLAFVVDDELPAAELVDAVHEAGGDELREVRVFDVYHGDQVGEGKKSVALHVAFQSSERTLSDEDAAALRERIVAAVAEQLGGVIRT
jgi:phenylalanyl-tRNA synthetase beta chain